MYIFDHVSLSSAQDEKYFHHRRENQNTHFTSDNIFLLNLAVYEIM